MVVEIRLTLLGGFNAQRADGAAVAFPTRKAQALLTIMACRPGESPPPERLMALLWSDRGDTQARHSLSQTLTSVRRALGETAILATERDTVVLSPGSVDADVATFQRLAASDALTDLSIAADLYRGPFLDGFKLRDPAFDDWLVLERARLHELAVIVMLKLAKGLAATSDRTAANAAIDRPRAIDPPAEEAYRPRLPPPPDQGAYNGAVGHYRQCADTLKRELNTVPEPATTAIYHEAMSRLEATEHAALRDKPIVNGNGDGHHSLETPGEQAVADCRRKA